MILMMVKTSQSFFISQIDYQKISPADALISWKILMNNRDITAAIQPNQGEGISIPVLAGRIMKLINQNSNRFKRLQSKSRKGQGFSRC